MWHRSLSGTANVVHAKPILPTEMIEINIHDITNTGTPAIVRSVGFSVRKCFLSDIWNKVSFKKAFADNDSSAQTLQVLI